MVLTFNLTNPEGFRIIYYYTPFYEKIGNETEQHEQNC